jgi:hypothetical protein
MNKPAQARFVAAHLFALVGVKVFLFLPLKFVEISTFLLKDEQHLFKLAPIPDKQRRRNGLPLHLAGATPPVEITE